jgi:uncharacterized protein
MTLTHEVHETRKLTVHEMVAHAAHLLPMQAPLHAFVHHNTLHAFEQYSFSEAVERAAAVLGAEPYPSESRFAEWTQSGRIQPQDIEEVLEKESTSHGSVFAGGPSEFFLRKTRLLHLFDVPQHDRLDWILSETPALHRIHDAVPPETRILLEQKFQAEFGESHPGSHLGEGLRALYAVCEIAAPVALAPEQKPRRRDQLLAQTGVDIDLWTHDLLVRFVSAFLDQGIAYWRMEDREQGMLAAFRKLWSEPWGPLGPIRSQLSRELVRQLEAQLSPEETIVQALADLGHPSEKYEDVIVATLLSLRGWAGMVRRLEERPDLSPVREFPCSLVEFLAIQLTLDKLAAAYLMAHGKPETSPSELEFRGSLDAGERDREVAYDAFVTAQLLGLSAGDLRTEVARDAFLRSVARFQSVERRRILFLAYERHYQLQVFDAFSAAPCASPRLAPTFQMVLCIDDREESFRRYLEELDSTVETFGFAGFFGVPMRFQGLEDRRPRALCPPVIEPKHTVYEVAVSGDEQDRYLGTRRAQARRALTLKVSSTSLLRGSLVSLLDSALALKTMVANILVPGLGRRPFHFKGSPPRRPKTRLALEKPEHGRAPTEGPFSSEGFTVSEMATIVAGALDAMGALRISPIFYLVGHGSNSVNNPHSSAYNCGATGGGHGGPNARAFAQMANHPEVRVLLAENGRKIPKDSWFVGACHDTANDSIEFFDEELIPDSCLKRHEGHKRVIARALEMNAQERCRRFESAKLGAEGHEAHSHVHARAKDLGQPRPELGHATNALCVVGRRARTQQLFLDRRAFLVSYDPFGDDDGKVLESLLRAVVPVGSGISLEYYFSTVDSRINGAGTKLPHNVAGLIGVMDGPLSDLRTGLPWQMVEIHEPMRLLCVIEAETAVILRVLERNPAMFEFVRRGWINVALLSPHDGTVQEFDGARFLRHVARSKPPVASSSLEFARGSRQHLPPAVLASRSLDKTVGHSQLGASS